MRYLLSAWMVLSGSFAEAQDRKNTEELVSEINIVDEIFSNPLFSSEARSNRVMDRKRKIETALTSLGCEDVLVAVNSVHSPSPKEGNIFKINASNCKVQKKSSTSCEAPFEARHLPAELGVDSYKACVKMKPTKNSQENINTGRS